MNELKCPFCKEQKDKNINRLNRKIAETDNLLVYPKVGGFVENYQLIVPKKHINCFGELSQNELLELKNIILWQKEINKKYFNSSTSIFEHGALKPNNESGKSIVHAHLHIFPNNISLIDEIKEYNFNIQKIDDIEQIKILCEKVDNYLYYRDIDDKEYFITHERIPSQFFRIILAKSQGIEEWDWRKYPFIKSIKRTVEFYRKNSLFL